MIGLRVSLEQTQASQAAVTSKHRTPSSAVQAWYSLLHCQHATCQQQLSLVRKHSHACQWRLSFQPTINILLLPGTRQPTSLPPTQLHTAQ